MPRLITLTDSLIIPDILHNLITVLLYIVSKKITINTPSHGTHFDIAPENHTLRAQTSDYSTGNPQKLWEYIMRLILIKGRNRHFLPEMLCIVVLSLKTTSYGDLKGFTFDVYLTV